MRAFTVTTPVFCATLSTTPHGPVNLGAPATVEGAGVGLGVGRADRQSEASHSALRAAKGMTTSGDPRSLPHDIARSSIAA